MAPETTSIVDNKDDPSRMQVDDLVRIHPDGAPCFLHLYAPFKRSYLT